MSGILGRVFGAVGKIGRGVAGGVTGFASGGPFGVVGGAVKGFTQPQAPWFGGPKPKRFGPADMETGGSSSRGGRGRGRQQMVNGKCPVGYHPAKDGKGCVRNRHMNFGNGRATSRAIRRIHGAEKQFRHIFHMTHPHKKGGTVAFKKKR